MPQDIPAWRRVPAVQWIVSLLYTTLLFLDSLLFGFVIVLFGWLPFPKLYGFARAWARLNLGLAKWLCGLDYAVTGAERIPREGAHVTMWKHTSTWETMAQMVVFPPQAWVLIFPEGTRMAPGETRKYGMSGALLASQAGVKLVPVAHDAGDYWPRRGLVKKPGRIRVVIGPPVEAAGRDPRTLNGEVQAWIEGTMRELRER